MKEGIQKNLCQTFCPYFKPSKEEGLACRGFLVVEKLLKKGLEIPFDKKDKKPGTKTQKTLIRNLCVSCPFYESDCDFVLQKQGAPPCGGFILLGHLLEKSIIHIDDIKNII